MATSQITVPVNFQDTVNLNSYQPAIEILNSQNIPLNRYIGQVTLYYDDSWSGIYDAVIFLNGDGATAEKITQTDFGMAILNMGYVIIEPIEPTTNMTGTYIKECPFPLNSSLVQIDPKHLMRARAGHIHKAICTGLAELGRRYALSSDSIDKLNFTLSGKFTTLAQSRGSRTAFYLANCRWNYPVGFPENFKYLNGVNYWFMAGFPFETTGTRLALKPQNSARLFSNTLIGSPRKSKLIMCMNDTDNLTGSDIRRILNYCIPDHRRADCFIINTEANGHYTEGLTQLEFLRCVKNDLPITLTFSNITPNVIPMLNVLGVAAKKVSEITPTIQV